MVSEIVDYRIHMDRTNFICYDKDENGRLIINLQQAETVKFIYENFLEGTEVDWLFVNCSG